MEIREVVQTFPKNGFSLRISRVNIYPSYFVVVKAAEKCGKSTFLRLLSGHLTPEKGTIVGDAYMCLYQSPDKRPKMRINEYLKTIIVSDKLFSNEFKKAQTILGLDPYVHYYIPDLKSEIYQKMIALISLFSEKNVICIDLNLINSSEEEILGIARLLRDTSHNGKTIICTSSHESFLKRADQIVSIIDGNCTIRNQTIWGWLGW